MGSRPTNPKIRSKIDYGCIVYNSARSRELVSLETVSNEAMRISSGCFKSTPLSSLQVITEEPPLQIRRDKLSLKYYYKVKTYYTIRLSNSSLQNKKPCSVSRGILAQQPFRGILTHCRLKKNYGTKQNFENGSRKPHYYTLK